MYHQIAVEKFVSFVQSRDGIADKEALIEQVQKEYDLKKERSVYWGNAFAVRFCASSGRNFCNTVLSLSALQKYDNMPFIVCIVTPKANILMLANTTFLHKISHSSQDLRVDNIKGSFNGSDILRIYEGIQNDPSNFHKLFRLHEKHTFSQNLERLVKATNAIHPIGNRFMPTDKQTQCIMNSVDRAISFMKSNEYHRLNDELQRRVENVSAEIAIAACCDNVNVRGRMIEFLITSADDARKTLVRALHKGKPLPEIYTADELGDYERMCGKYRTATDIKTKLLFLSSNPKGYNLDKLLSFLAKENSVYLVYIVAINKNNEISTRLCSMYSPQLLNGTRIIRQWAGRNSRGVTQYDGTALEEIISNFDSRIDRVAATEFIRRCLKG